jgi:hypothetical protein
VTGLFVGGGQAVEAYHQQKHNQLAESRYQELDARTRALEEAKTQPMPTAPAHPENPSQRVKQILEAGRRPRESFAAALAALPDNEEELGIQR